MNFYVNVAQKGNNILVRSIENGKHTAYKVPYRPYLFIPAKGVKKTSEFHTLEGEPVEKIYFDSGYEMREFIKRYEGVENFKYYGLTSPVYTFIDDNSSPEVKYDASQLNIVNIDIEVSSKGGFATVEAANKSILTIALRQKGRNVVFGMKPYKARPDTQYVYCQDEEDLLQKFLLTWNDPEWLPDIITGWSIDHYDIPYLVRRITQVLGEDKAKLLSPWRVINRRTISTMFMKEEEMFDLLGISIVDGLQLYKKFSYTPQESYRLDHIAFSELKERKLDYSQFRGLDDLYERDFQRFVDYNIHDVELVEKIEEKKGFIKLVLAIAYNAKINFQDAFTTVKRWDIIIHNHLMQQKIVIPKMKERPEAYQGVEGAYVKDPIVGMHDWVVSFDVNSLYPSLIQQFNISPDVLLGQLPDVTVEGVLKGQLKDHPKFKDNITIAATGCMFSKRKQGFLAEIVEKLQKERVKWKNLMLDKKKEMELVKMEIKRRELAI